MKSKLLTPDSKLSKLDLLEILNSEGIEECIQAIRYLDFEKYNTLIKGLGSLLKELAEGVAHICEDSDEIVNDVLANLESCTTEIECKAREAAGNAHAKGCCIESCAASTVISAVAGFFSSPHNKPIYAIDACNAAALAHPDGWGYVVESFLKVFES